MLGRLWQVMVRDINRVQQLFVLLMAAYNLTRMCPLGELGLQGA